MRIFVHQQIIKEMQTQIELKDIYFYASHGLMAQERKVGNTFVVNLLLTVPFAKAMESDDVIDTVDYGTVYEVVKKEMEEPSNLIEHVAGRIINALHNNFPAIEEVELQLSKMNPPIGAQIESASVIIKEKF